MVKITSWLSYLTVSGGVEQPQNWPNGFFFTVDQFGNKPPIRATLPSKIDRLSMVYCFLAGLLASGEAHRDTTKMKLIDYEESTPFHLISAWPLIIFH